MLKGVEMTNLDRTATLAGGCFWCLGSGVRRCSKACATMCCPATWAATTHDPSYGAVCRGTTGTREVVQGEVRVQR